MKKFHCLLFTLLISNFLGAQDRLHKTFYNDTTTTDLSVVSFDNDDNSLVIGTSYFNSAKHYIATKYDANGNILWSKTLNDTVTTNYIPKFCHHTNDDSWIIGGTMGTPVFIKLDQDGNIVWSRRYSTLSSFNPMAITEDNAGNLYVAGGGCDLGVLGLVKLDPLGNTIW